jgi:membrane-associated protease RseP (regulator of RpoE activity)
MKRILLLLAGSLLPILPGRAQEKPAHETPSAVPYLGVATVPAPPPVTAQLKLPADFGLLVVDVVKDSPAATAGLQPNDVLVKLEDQQLIEPNQLAALVRSRKPDEQITLTLIRAGETQTQTVKLGRRPAPKNARLEGRPPRSLLIRQDLPTAGAGPEKNILLRRSISPGEPIPFAGQVATVLVDGHRHYHLVTEAGGDVLIVSDSEQNQLFRGPVSSPEDRNKVPEEFRGMLKKMEEVRGTMPPLSIPLPPPPGPWTGPAGGRPEFFPSLLA